MLLDLHAMVGPDSWLPLPLVGRHDELTAMRRAMDAAANGHAGAVMIAGGYGVGKTRLLEAMLSEAQQRDFVIAPATASQTDADVPYSIFVDAFTAVVRSLSAATRNELARGTTADLARVVPAFDASLTGVTRAPDAPDDLTTRVRWHFTQFLERLAARKPLVLSVDNAHWADPSSVGLVQFILRHAPRARLLVIATHNPLESDVNSAFRATQRGLAGRDHVRQLTLAPLTQDDLLELLETAFGVPQAALADFGAALFARTLGNPFFIEEMLKSLVERGVLRLVNREWVGWTTEEFELPATVREVVLSRVAALTGPARELLDALSAFSTRVPDELLAETAGLAAPAFVRAAEELRTRHLMNEVETPHGIACDVTHPLLRRTVYEELGAVRRRALHGRIVGAIERYFGAEADAHATELSYHCVRAGAADVVAKGWRYLVTAGRDALAKHADREAAAYLKHAVDSPLAPEAEVIPLVEDLARVRQRLGEYDAARSLWIRSRESHRSRADHAGLARVERRLGVLSVLKGEADHALGHFGEALSCARSAARPDIEVSTLVSMSLALANLGRIPEAKARVQEALAVVEASGDVVQRARVERALVELYTYTGPASVAIEYGRRALEHALSSGERALAWSAHWTSAVLAGITANADGVVEHTREAAAIARELNSPSLAAHVDEVMIEFASAKGDWAEALRVAERAIPVARAVAPRTLLPRILVWTGTVLLNRDDVEEAKAVFDEAWEQSRAGATDGRAGDVHAVIVSHIGQAAFSFATRDWTRAIDYAQRGIALGDRHGIIAWSVHRLFAIVAEAALYAGDFALTESAARRLRVEAEKLEHRMGLLYAEAMEVFLAQAREPGPTAIPVLLQVAERAEGVPYVFHAARLRRNVARLMLRAGDRDGASRELRRAHDTFQRLGAQLELRLTREQMRRHGWRPPQRPGSGRGALTMREREIALLAAQGQANKEIGATLEISWRTVSRHLASVYGKLGVDSRVELVEAVRRMAEGR
jgi:DNA-binding NarL/FixJ family response regulator/tetratricopeptide (TPR) repeat protein